MYYIIVNPVAGKGRAISHIPLLIKEFESLNLPCKLHVTAKAKDAYEIANKICTQDTPHGVIGVGGDGTIQEIVAGMVDAHSHGKHIPTPLAIYPVGSGNDFITSLYGGKSYAKKQTNSPKIFIEKICARRLRTIDVITANGQAFLNIANIGVDARIVQNALALKKTHGKRAYLASVYKSITQHKNTPINLEVNRRQVTQNFTLVAICNGQFYGGGLRIAPSAQFDDGKITLCTIDGVSRTKLGILFPSLLIEKHVRLKIVKFEQCTELKLTLQNAEILCLDGNLIPSSGEIYFKILPKVLDVFV